MLSPTSTYRRRFLKHIAVHGLACAWLPSQLSTLNEARIEKVEAFAVRYPMTGHFKFFTGPHGGQGRASVLVKITTADGMVGWGQSVPIAKWSYETLETVQVVLQQYFAPALLGLDCTDLAAAQSAMSKSVADGFSIGMPIARAGVDLALHDLMGKRVGQSVAQLWGRKTGPPLRLSWTLNPRNLDEVDALMAAGKQRGYRDFNIKVGPDPDYDFALTSRVRELAPDAFLWTDANGGYTPDAALKAAPLLAKAGVSILEAPLKPNQIQGYQKLTAMNALPILMDEGVITPVELREFIRLKMLNGVAMKPSRCGGLQSAKAQIEMLEQHGMMWVGSGLTDPDVSLAATLQLFSAFGLKTAAALNGPQFVTESLLKQPLEVVDGSLAIPDGPGLGVEIDEAKLADLVARTAATSRSDAALAAALPAHIDGGAELAALDLRWNKQPGKSLALLAKNKPLWKFHYDAQQAHCYFHPLSLPDCPPLTVDSPADHVWHHGLWFSWKYINGVNFWENAAGRNRPAGRTSWLPPKVHTFPNRAAKIVMELLYASPEHGELLTEKRALQISPPAADGSYHIDWTATFTALADEVTLDRTPLPGEPGGQAWGGYAGLSLRMANWQNRSAQTSDGLVQFNEQNRYRGRHRAFDYQGVQAGKDVGICIEELASNLNEPTPWYCIRSEQMSFFTPAVICYGARTLRRGDHFTLRYRIHIHAGHWSLQDLHQTLNSSH